MLRSDWRIVVGGSVVGHLIWCIVSNYCTINNPPWIALLVLMRDAETALLADCYCGAVKGCLVAPCTSPLSLPGLLLYEVRLQTY